MWSSSLSPVRMIFKPCGHDRHGVLSVAATPTHGPHRITPEASSHDFILFIRQSSPLCCPLKTSSCVLYFQPLLKAASVTRQSGESGERMMGLMARVGMVALLSWALVVPWNLVMAAEEEQPKDFKYYQIWTSQDGETHIADCKVMGFNLTPYALLPQYVRSDFGGEPIGFVLTELPVNFTEGLHSPPAVQFVATLAGSWYIGTTDGSRHVFKKGQLLFQDNTAKSPADKQPMHSSGTHGDKPCDQLVVQISRPPQVDNPCPFS